MPKTLAVEADSIVEFNKRKSSQINEIQKFLFDASDWVAEKTRVLGSRKSPSKKEISSMQLSNAEAQI